VHIFKEEPRRLTTHKNAERGRMLAALCWVPRAALLDKPLIHELSAEEKAMLSALPPDAPALPNVDDADAVDLTANQIHDLRLNQGDLDMGGDDDSDLGSDVDDHYLKPSDLVVLTASVEDDHSSLEMHVYDTETGSLYVHHDISLPAYPLALEFLGCNGADLHWSESSNAFVAVGTFEPDIEIWSLDVLDALEPNAVLKGHKEAVLSLAWNTHHRSLLASGSGDKSCVLWDLTTSTVAKTFQHHTDKVQTVAWNPAEASVLLTASFDHYVCILDARSPLQTAMHGTRQSDVEDAAWDVHNPAMFAVATEDGYLSLFDVRIDRGAVVAWNAHPKACSSVSCNAQVSGLWATCSTDKSIRLWDMHGGDPVCLGQKRAGVGKLFTCEFVRGSKENPVLIAAGGSDGKLALWHALDDVQLARERIRAEPVVWPSPTSSSS